MMSSRSLLAAGLFSLLALPELAIAQTTYELYNSSNGGRSRITVSNAQLLDYRNGVIFRYRRAPQLDRNGFRGYFNVATNDAIRWPTSNRGRFQFGTQTQFGLAFQTSVRQIVGPTGGGVTGSGVTGGGVTGGGPTLVITPGNIAIGFGTGAPGAPAQRNRPKSPYSSVDVVIESALKNPTTGAPRLVSVGLGVSSNVHAGGAEPSLSNNQFRLTQVGGEYFSLVPLAQKAMIVDIPRAQATEGANIWLLNKDNASAAASQFRLVPAGNDFYYIETKLRRGYVWDIDESSDAGAPNVQLMPRTGVGNQLFRVYQPGAMGVASRSDSSLPSSGGSTRSRPLSAVRVELGNTQRNDLWVLMVDRRHPTRPKRLKIPAGESVKVRIDRDGDRNGRPAEVIYELSVYELVRQSVSIDATQRGKPKVTGANYAPQSVGWFEIPPGNKQKTDVIDVYYEAKQSGQPGRVARIDPSLWDAADVGEIVPGATATAGSNDPKTMPQPIDPDGPFSDGPFSDGPFGVGSEEGLGNSLAAKRCIAEHLEHESCPFGVPRGMLETCLARRTPAGEIQLVTLIEETKTQEYTVDVPYTAQVAGADGKLTPTTRTRQETRVREYSVSVPLTETIPADRCQVFLAECTQFEGAPLGADAIEWTLEAEKPAVVLRPGQKLDPTYLPLLAPPTPIVVIDNQYAGAPRIAKAMSADRRKAFPSTPIRFLGASINESGALQLYEPHSEWVERAIEYVDPETGDSITHTKQVAAPKARPGTLLKPGAYRVYSMAGKRISGKAAGERLAEPQTVVFVAAGQKIDRWYAKLLNPATLVVMERKAK